MRIRIYFPFVPFPAIDGAKLVVSDQMRGLQEAGHEVELVVWRESEATLNKKRSLGGTQGASKWTLLAKGRESRCERMSRVGSSLFGELASPEIYHYPPELLKTVSLLEPVDLAIYHYSYAYSWLSVRDLLPPERKRVVHMHNLESELHGLRGGLLSPIHLMNARKLRQHEQELSNLADELWFLSAEDARNLGVKSAKIVPPTFSPELRMRRPTQQLRDVVVGFIGALDFGPNFESVQWILRDLAPELLSSGFSGRILIGGRGPSNKLLKLGERYSFVEFCGFVEDVEEFWAHLSFLAVPHIVGSGVRTKILEGIASGVPVLTNVKGMNLLPEGVRNNPFLICCKDVGDWGRRIMSEREAFMTRKALAYVPPCSELSAEAVYGDAI